MSPRKTLRGVALGLLGFCVSRNNDIDGYWGMGKLYAAAPPDSTVGVSINLLTRRVYPTTAQLGGLVDDLTTRLRKHMEALRLPADRLSSGIVTVYFNIATSTPARFETASDGEVFECIVHLVDDLGRSYRESTSGRCWRHNPLKESKSAR